MEQINWQEFAQMDIRVGTVIEARHFPAARKKAYQLVVDFGAEMGTKKTSAQITELYEVNDLTGKQVVAIVNFPPKQIANFMSECLILGAVDGAKVFLIAPDRPIKNGLKIG
ncbi:MAG: tRNA-binding protein [Nonlabens sp.]